MRRHHALGALCLAVCAVVQLNAAAVDLQQHQQQQQFALAAHFGEVTSAPGTSPHLLKPVVETHQPRKPHSAFSEWARDTKRAFVADISHNSASDYIVVMGNEAGDLDSMVSALAWSWYLAQKPPVDPATNRSLKAIALLQTEVDALDLRPENQLALKLANMSTGHKDLLTLSDLPIGPPELNHRIAGIALVDHNLPLAKWRSAPTLSIFDHHADEGHAKSAYPRVIEKSASCSSLVVREIMSGLGLALDGSSSPSLASVMPEELRGLLLRTVAIDSDGLDSHKTTTVDRDAVRALYPGTEWARRGEEPKAILSILDDEMSKMRKTLDGLQVRDLLRRDWKGDSIPTECSDYPTISLGIASVPMSMDDMISVTPEGTTPEWFAIERAFTSEIGADVSVVMTSFKETVRAGARRLAGRDEDFDDLADLDDDEDEDDDVEDVVGVLKKGKKGKSKKKKKAKRRELAIVVAHGWVNRLDEAHAQSLFDMLVDEVEGLAHDPLEALKVRPWKRPDGKELLPRRAVWHQVIKHGGNGLGRKAIRPLLEKAIRRWQGVRRAESESRDRQAR